MKKYWVPTSAVSKSDLALYSSWNQWVIEQWAMEWRADLGKLENESLSIINQMEKNWTVSVGKPWKKEQVPSSADYNNKIFTQQELKPV